MLGQLRDQNRYGSQAFIVFILNNSCNNRCENIDGEEAELFVDFTDELTRAQISRLGETKMLVVTCLLILPNLPKF